MKKIRDLVVLHRGSLLTGFLIIFFSSVLFLPRLGSLVPGHSVYDHPHYLGLSKDGFLSDISYAPLKAGQKIMVLADDNNATLIRFVSVVAVVVASCLLYLLLRHWHTRRVSLMATFLFATSSVSLQFAHTSNKHAMLLGVIPTLLLCSVWFKSKKTLSRLPLISALMALTLYVPGMLVILPALALVYRRRLLLVWRYVGKHTRNVSLALFVLLASPLVAAVAMRPAQLKGLLGFAGPFDISSIRDRAISIPDQLLYRGFDDPALWLVGTPILDVATLAFVLLGVYSYVKGPHPLRFRILVGLVIGVVGLVVLGAVPIYLLLPLVYIFAASGIALLLQQWFTVFPRNPFARNFAVVWMIILLVIVAGYHVRRSYLAWPNAPATKQAYQRTE